MSITMEPFLTLVWFAIIAFGVFMYVLMDGFVLGIGILFPAAPSQPDRDLMMNSVAPIWDGNETWLVLGGASLFAAFPVAYAVLLPALYLPLLAMLIALVFRGVAFEFRFKATSQKRLWSIAFSLGSITATFAQGVVLGTFVQGFSVVDNHYGGSPLDWVTPFGLITGFALLGGYALLGATWLIIKAEGELQDWAYRITVPLLITMVVFMVIVSLWVPFLDTDIAKRWFSWPNIVFLAPVPVLAGTTSVKLYRAVQQRHEVLPFVLAMVLFLLNYAGLAISVWPNIVPPNLSIWDAASPPETQTFLLVGMVVLLPIILFYTGYSYWVFRGKITRDISYY
jgi:cytochrome d ubiquinol oxidase subunit II